ncbi:MAG: response regulator [Treponema sp.]|nr:response regulator [Treponema sp.]
MRKTSPYIVMVVIAFLLMGVVSYYSANTVMRERLLENSNSALKLIEANIAESLARADLMLLNPYHFIRNMLDQGADPDAILEYLRNTTNWMRRSFNGTPGFYGLYAYINGRFLDGIDLNPGPGYDFTAAPWYRTAESLRDGELAYTAPYSDPRSGERIITAVRNLYSLDGTCYGSLAMDIGLIWLRSKYAISLDLFSESYAFILNQDFRVISHPENSHIGSYLQDFNGDYRQITEELPLTGEISNRRITDIDDKPAMIHIRQIRGNWYAAMVTPMENYYEDLYNIEINPAFLGLILILMFSMVMLRINAAVIHSSEISSYKSAFLAQMSHEIRTPMNVVIGISELAMREKEPAKILEYLESIKRAGHHLLSIINDILDISRIESGVIKITPVSYYFASLLNDVISMIRVKIAEKPVIFIANIDASIPNSMIGDETRVKQVLINLLSNAAKYTQEGFIALNIQGKIRDGKVFLTIEVSDTGVGIKKNDLSTIFEKFTRLDWEKNQGVEGAGLGLVITRNLCRAMGGEITVISEYGEGSTFTATISQDYDNDEEIASVENTLNKRVLCYETRANYAASIFRTLNSLKVAVKICDQKDEFFRELEHNRYSHIFIPAELAEKTLELVKARFLPVNLVLLANSGELVSYQHIPMLIMPAYSVPIANVLNNRTVFDQRKLRSIHFIAPNARILIVDDIATNVKVAEGLLTLYQPGIDVCYDGKTSVEMARKHHYDIVFMDHMMPGMNGIEAVAAIRALDDTRFKTLPIVALTANATFGMKEAFLANGFNDYLAKPIEITKLDEIMTRWIPQEKRIQRGRADPAYPDGVPQNPLQTAAPGGTETRETGIINIEGVDVHSGMKNSDSSSWADYREILSFFCQDVTNRIEFLRNMPAEKDFTYFHTQIHAIQGAAVRIGAAETAEKAKILEETGKNGNPNAIRADINTFTAELETLIARVRAVLAESNETTGRNDD